MPADRVAAQPKTRRDRGRRGPVTYSAGTFTPNAATEGLYVPAAVDIAAIVIGALTGGLLAAREGFAVSGVLLLAVSTGLGGGLILDVLLAEGPPACGFLGPKMPEA